MDQAALCSHINVVEFLHLNRSEGCDRALILATEFCDLEVVKYLVENGIGLDRLQEAIDEDINSDFEGGDCEKHFRLIKLFLCLEKWRVGRREC